MMWRAFNMILGWRYIAIPYAFGTSICRVRIAPSGIEYIKCCGDMFFLRDGEAIPLAPSSYARKFIRLTRGIG